MMTAGIFAAAILLSALTGGIFVLSLLLASCRRRLTSLENETRLRQDRLESALGALQDLATFTSPAAEPSVPKRKKQTQILPASARANILKDLNVGLGPEEIASKLGVTAATVRLVLEVNKLAGQRPAPEQALYEIPKKV